MLKNSKGFSAIFDVSVFIVIILLCVPLIFYAIPENEHGIEAGDAMDVLTDTRLRISDVTNSDDSTVCGLYDLLAYSVYSGDKGPMEFVKSYLDSVLSGHDYLFSAEFKGKSDNIGSLAGDGTSYSERTCKVSSGGEVVLRLEVG